MLTMRPPGRIRAATSREQRIVPLQIELEQRLELALGRPARSLAGEHVGAGVVDPDVDVLERGESLSHDRAAPVAPCSDPPEAGDGTGPS